MTVTSHPQSAHAPRRGFGRRAARSFVALVGAALLVVGAPLAAAPAMAAPVSAVSTPTPTPTSDVPPGVTVFTLSPVGAGTVRPGESLAVSVTLQNGTDAATDALPVTLALGSATLRDRAALGRWLAGDVSGVNMVDIGSTVIPPVPTDAEQVESIFVTPDNPALANRAPGVYPLVATYAGPDGPVRSTSVMIVPNDAPAQNGIGVVVSITAPRTTAGLLTSVELAALTAPTGSLSTQLDAVDGTAAILAVDPAIVAAIRVLGTAAPASAAEWLQRLMALPNSRFALQFGDADVATQLEAGAARPLQPTSLQSYMRPANFLPVSGSGVGSSATPTPRATPDSGNAVDPAAPVYPTLEELLDIGDSRDGVYWPATGTSTPAVVSTLGALTTEDRGSLTLISSRSTTAGATGDTVPAHALAGEADALVYDTDISAALHQASLIDDGWLRGAPLAAAAAYLAFAATDAPGAPLLVTLERDTDRSRVGMRTAITTALQAPGFTALTLAGVTAIAPGSVEIASAEPNAVRADAASSLFVDEDTLTRFATILDDPTLLTGPQRAEILQILGVDWLTVPQQWGTAVTAHRASTAKTLDSVGILPPTPVNLISAGAPLPVWVRNDLPYPVNVVLYAIPDDLRLDVKEANVVAAGAAANTLVKVPVQARVGSGQVNVEMQLRSRTYEPIGASQTAEVNVRADWEGIGIVILAILVGGFLVLGLVRTVLRVRARARRRTEPASEKTDEDPQSN